MPTLDLSFFREGVDRMLGTTNFDATVLRAKFWEICALVPSCMKEAFG